MFKVINGWFEPVRSTKYSACVDLFAREDVTIGAGETKIVNLGVKIDLAKFQLDNKMFREDKFREFLKSHKLDLHIRSSLSAKKGLIIANGTGQIDLDYPDEIGIILHNPYKHHKFFKKFRPDGDSNREFFFVTDSFKIADDIWENSYSQNELYNEGKIFKTYEAAQEYIKDCICKIKKGDKMAQITLVEHKSYLMGYESEEERIGGYGSTGE